MSRLNRGRRVMEKIFSVLRLASRMVMSLWTGLNGSQTVITKKQIEQDLKRLVMDGRESCITFNEFPYFLSEQTRVLLTSAAHFRLKHCNFSKHTINLTPASKAILLSGPSELYLQRLANALAHLFEAKLLVLDVDDFSRKMVNEYVYSEKELSSKRSTSRFSGFFSTLLPQREETKVHINGTNNWAFDEKVLLQSLYKVLVSVSEEHSIILYVRDVAKVLQSDRFYEFFQKMLDKLSESVLILGSYTWDDNDDEDDEDDEGDQRETQLFPYVIEVQEPDDETHRVSWDAQLEEEKKTIEFQEKKNQIAEVLAANDLDCDDLGSICHADNEIVSEYVQEIVISALSYHVMNNKDPEYRNRKLVISSESLSHGLSIFEGGIQETNSQLHAPQIDKESEKHIKSVVIEEANQIKPQNDNEFEKHIKSEVIEEANQTIRQNDNEFEKHIKSEAIKEANQMIHQIDNEVEKHTKSEVIKEANQMIHQIDNEVEKHVKSEVIEKANQKILEIDNEFEKHIKSGVIEANQIGVTFEDVGALDDIKESLKELVMLPLRRPELFKGGLLKPCRGILLFGPPGTGKTMLAKAIANEAGASFINVSMSTITSHWFGDDEKNVRALFTLAAKISPAIIFVDEVDSMLGQRGSYGEFEGMRTIKNEFMTHWDGLATQAGKQILVLAATNRPFDLDQAVIRRFERRIMVGLPSTESREMILKTFLAKEKAEDLDFKELATMTDGYTGSDLKNLCMAAAYRPVRELLQQERKMKDKKKKQDDHEGQSSEKEIVLRTLNMEDMRQAKNQIAASFATEGLVMDELKHWNALYGEGGSRTTKQLTYFL